MKNGIGQSLKVRYLYDSENKQHLLEAHFSRSNVGGARALATVRENRLKDSTLKLKVFQTAP